LTGVADDAAAETLATQLEKLLAQAGLPTSLESCGVPKDSLIALAGEAANQWTARFNPRPAGSQEFLELYRAAWNSRP
jgi:alcohol dehydrogenase